MINLNREIPRICLTRLGMNSAMSQLRTRTGEGLKTGQVKPGQVFFSTFMSVTSEILDVS